MDFQYGKISIWLAMSMVILGTGLMAHVLSIPVILNIAGRDSWVAVILAAPFFIAWIFIYYKIIHKLEHTSIIYWMEIHWGKTLSWIMKFIFSAILFFNAFYTVIDTVLWTNSTYLQQTPMIVIALCMLLLCMATAYSGLQSIAIVSSILLPLVIFLGYFVSISNVKYKDFSLLFPIFDNGFSPTIHGSFYVMASLLDIWIIILFSHHVKKKLTKLQILLFSLFFLMMVLGPITGAISEFGPTEAVKQRHTTYDQWKILSIGQLMQHVDFLSIYQWLSGAIIRTTISMYLMVDVFQLKRNKSRFTLLVILNIIMFSLLFIPWRDDLMLLLMQNIYFPTLCVFVLLLTTTLIITQWFVKRKELQQRGT